MQDNCCTVMCCDLQHVCTDCFYLMVYFCLPGRPRTAMKAAAAAHHNCHVSLREQRTYSKHEMVTNATKGVFRAIQWTIRKERDMNIILTYNFQEDKEFLATCKCLHRLKISLDYTMQSPQMTVRF